MRRLIDRVLGKKGASKTKPEPHPATERTAESEINREQTRELVSNKVELAFLGFEERFSMATGMHKQLAATIWKTPFA